MFVFTFGAENVSPVALTDAISVNPMVISSDSGLYGFCQMAVGALYTAVAGLGQSPALAAAVLLTASGIAPQVSFWIAFRSHRARQ
jgi:DHA1 family bicyclomycin/chloramphenicol resistance-like MFS transporter